MNIEMKNLIFDIIITFSLNVIYAIFIILDNFNIQFIYIFLIFNTIINSVLLINWYKYNKKVYEIFDKIKNEEEE